MAETLTGRKALVIATNYGVESSELLVPIEFLRAHGAEVTVAAPEKSDIQTLVMDTKPGKSIPADAVLADVDPANFDVVVVPGGTLNADALRRNADAQHIVQKISGAGKPVAAICHAPWLLVEAGLARGAELTSYSTLQSDLKNAGAAWQDREVVVDHDRGYTLITSRSPADLDAFTQAIEQAVTA
jgi:protease I